MAVRSNLCNVRGRTCSLQVPSLPSSSIRVYSFRYEDLRPELGVVLLLRLLYGRALWSGQARHLSS